jgi:hypothetical protein
MMTVTRKAISAVIGTAVMPVSYTCRATETGRSRRRLRRVARKVTNVWPRNPNDSTASCQACTA